MTSHVLIGNLAKAVEDIYMLMEETHNVDGQTPAPLVMLRTITAI